MDAAFAHRAPFCANVVPRCTTWKAVVNAMVNAAVDASAARQDLEMHKYFEFNNSYAGPRVLDGRVGRSAQGRAAHRHPSRPPPIHSVSGPLLKPPGTGSGFLT